MISSRRLACLSLLLTLLVAMPRGGALAQQPGDAAALVERLSQLIGRASLPLTPGVAFDLMFEGEVGPIEPGAEVLFGGQRVGMVSEATPSYDTATGALTVPVTIEIQPGRIAVDGRRAQTAEEVHDAVATLVRRGLRASSERAGLISDQRMIKLALLPDAPATALPAAGVNPAIPTVPGKDGAVEQGIERFVARLEAIPVEQLADEAQKVVAALGSVIGSPEFRAMTNDLMGLPRRLEAKLDPALEGITRAAAAAGGTAEDARRALAQLDGRVGARAPIWGDLQSLMRELNGTARSLRLLLEYLERHPDAIIRGKPGAAP